MLGHHLAQRQALGVAQVRDRRRIQRARDSRAAEQAAAEARALLVREVHERDSVRRAVLRRAPQHLDPGHHAQRPIQPAPRRHGVQMRPDGDRPVSLGPGSVAHRFAASSTSTVTPSISPRRARKKSRGGLPLGRPAHAAGAVRAARQAVELAQVGDRPRRLDGHQLHSFAAQRLHQAMRAAAAQRERRELGVVHRQPERPQPVVEVLGLGRREHAVRAQAHAVDAELEGRSTTGTICTPRPSSQRTNPPPTASTHTAASPSPSMQASTSMCTKCGGMRSMRTSHPSAQPAGHLPGGRLCVRSRRVADHGDSGCDDREVAALEGRRGDHVAERIPASW